MEVLANLGDQLGESPLWSPEDNALWWVDIEGRRLHRLDWESRLTQTWEAPERVSALARLAGGGVLVAGEARLFRVVTDDSDRATFTVCATHEHPYEGMRFNDGRTDRGGTFFISSLQRDRSGQLPSGSVHQFAGQGLRGPVVGGLITPNGMAFAPDNRLMYLCDSHPSVQRIWVFDRDPIDGTLLRRREFVDMTPMAGRPDGAAIDDEGCYWVCATDAGMVLRFDPAGRLDRRLQVPVAKPTMCAFAGPRRDYLVVTSMQVASPLTPRPALDGAVFLARPGVAGPADSPVVLP